MEYWLGALAIGLLIWVGLSHSSQRRAMKNRIMPTEPVRYPSVSVIRPIKGFDSGEEENIRCAFQSDYPGEVEILFVFDDQSEPALATVERVMAERRHKGQTVNARVLFSGQPPATRTGKLNAMIVGMEAAKNELIAFIDSDVREDSEILRILVATLLADDKAGSAFPPVASVAVPTTVGDAGCALMINGLYEPGAMAAAEGRHGALPYIMGHMMVLTRGAIAAIGGLESAEGQLVDDMFLGRRLTQFGYRNKLAPKAVAIHQQDTTFSQFVQILIRWIAFSMSGLPLYPIKVQHWLTGIAFWVGLIMTLFGGVTGQWILALLGSLLALSVPAMINDLHKGMTGAPLPFKYCWASIMMWLVAPVVYAQVVTRREVNWRGRRYRINSAARLDQV